MQEKTLKKYIFILILFIVIIMVFVFYYTKNNKKENNIIEENFTEVTSVQVIEETEGGYKYYKTKNKQKKQQMHWKILKLEKKTTL